MIVVGPPRLLQGISNVMEEIILPAVEVPYARGQGYSAIELLRDIVLVWEDLTDLYLADNGGLVRLLRQYRKLMAGRNIRHKKGNLNRVLDKVELKTAHYDKARDDNLRLRASLNDALVALNGLPQKGTVRSLRNAIRRHLKEQLNRELNLKLESHSALGRLSKA